jgi:hypothetical protein
MPFFQIMLWRELKRQRDEEVTDSKASHYCFTSSNVAPFGVFFPLPLDEYCSPFLFDNDLARERKCKDQVLSRVQQGGEDKKIITISQLWLWKDRNISIISPLKDLSLKRFSLIYGGKYPNESLLKEIGILLSSVIRMPEEPSGSILDNFEKAITQVSEAVNIYLEREGIENIKIESEKKYLHRIGDIREELSMIRRVLVQQEDVWKDFASNTWPKYWITGRMIIPVADLSKISFHDRNIWKKIMKPQELFVQYRRRISQLNEDAERVQGVILVKLDLKQKHASLREAHSTAIMSAAVLGFTIVTVIFTPLAFVMALFALPIKQFQDNQVPSKWGDTEKPSGVYTTNYIGKFTGTSRPFRKYQSS